MDTELILRDCGLDTFCDNETINYANKKLSKYMVDDVFAKLREEDTQHNTFVKILRNMDEESAKSLWFAKNILMNDSSQNIDEDREDYRNLLIDYLENERRPIEAYIELIDFKIDNFLPSTYLEWFKDDLRCSLFLTYIMRDMIRSEVFKGGKELRRFIVDYIRYNIFLFNRRAEKNLPEFEHSVRMNQRSLTRVILLIKASYLKNRTRDRDIQWLDVINKKQIEWAYDYVSHERHPYLILQNTFFPETISEKYDLILASLDTLSNVLGSYTKYIGAKNNVGIKLTTRETEDCTERQYFLNRMSKAWTHYQHDSKNSKKKLVLKINLKNQGRLYALAKNADQTPNKFINQAIEDTYKVMLGNEN